MPRDLVRRTCEIDSATRAFDWGSMRAGFLALLLFFIGWALCHFVRLVQANDRPFYVFIVFLQCALVICIKRSVQPTQCTDAWKYRISFTLSLLLGIFYLIIGLLSSDSFDLDRFFAWSCVVGTGSFLGAMILTKTHEGLAENNSPPDESTQYQVFQFHHNRIGDGDPINQAKRIFDFIIALFAIILTTPFWLACIFFIWFEDPGPILFIKNSVTRGGYNFRQYKFRTMVRSAEEGIGPVLAREQDERILLFGRLLRKTALDELPQLLNILRGEMSFVGPRPQRTILVADYLQSMPEYTERHRVLPGLAGLAQVAGDYYLTPRQKLRFDKLYIQHASLGYDLKLLCLAFLITFWYRWQPGWNGRLPRRYLHSLHSRKK